MGFFRANKFISGYSKLEIGMPKEEVLSLFGEPNGQKVKNGEETLIWTNSEFKGALRGGTIERRIEVTFEDGKVTGYDGQNMSQGAW